MGEGEGREGKGRGREGEGRGREGVGLTTRPDACAFQHAMLLHTPIHSTHAHSQHTRPLTVHPMYTGSCFSSFGFGFLQEMW